MNRLYVFICFLVFFVAINAMPKRKRIIDVDDYLRKFHYIGSGNPDPRFKGLTHLSAEKARKAGLRLFQKKWGLPVSGIADEATIRKMAAPRCGMPDIETMEDMPNMDRRMEKFRAKVRDKRYVLQGSSWDKNHLFYRISQYTPDLPKEEVDDVIRRAFKLWSDVTPLDFTQVFSSNDRVDIDIRFTPIVHGDGFDFDGVGGTLAHAFYPQYGGATHFDDSETWTIGTYEGINLLQVAAHEFGHALGLRHSEDITALMYPFYGGYIPDFTLPHDDTAGIQAIYGSPTESTVTPISTTLPSTTPGIPDICNEGVLDAVTTQMVNGKSITYAFRGQHYMQLTPSGVVDGIPRMISSDWLGVSHVDAALTMEYEMWRGQWRYRMVTYLFSGERYYKFIYMTFEHSGYIRRDWGLPSHLDAIFQYSGDGKIYAIKGSEYYTINSITDKRPEGNPRPLSDWGVYGVDAAFMTKNGGNGRDTIFFKGTQFYKVNESTQRVGYPRSTLEHWLGCDSNGGNNLVPFLGMD